ncbi:MAG: hypothetical protein AAGM36_07545 [Cyanobacteria bacterium J06597_1]
MKIIRKAVSKILLLWAVIVAAFSVAMLFNEQAFTRKSAVPAFLIFGAPALGAGGWLAYGVRRQDENEQAVLLQQTFYRLVMSQSGSIAVFQLAMVAGVSGDRARAYLDRCAYDFDGAFDLTDDGRVLYRFDVSGLNASSSASLSVASQTDWEGRDLEGREFSTSALK